MFTVRGLPIYYDEVEIIRELKRQLAENGIHLFNKIKRTGDNIMVSCPNPEHAGGQERKPSCGIRINDGRDSKAGQVHCFACGYTAPLEEMISMCFGYPGTSYGEDWLLENFVTGDGDERPHIPCEISREIPDIFNIGQPTQNYIKEEELQQYRQFYHDYMWKRKLTPEIVEKYDVGYQPDFRLETKNEDGTTTIWPPIECLTFPCRDINGNTLFVSRRAIHNKNFFLPTDFEKPVYGLYELPKDAKVVIICESVINALTCVVYGVPAVALFGTGTQYQAKQLNDLPVRKYVLGLDPDRAGNKGTYRLKKALKGKILTKLILPEGKDINDLSREEFYSLPEVYV